MSRQDKTCIIRLERKNIAAMGQTLLIIAGVARAVVKMAAPMFVVVELRERRKRGRDRVVVVFGWSRKGTVQRV